MRTTAEKQIHARSASQLKKKRVTRRTKKENNSVYECVKERFMAIPNQLPAPPPSKVTWSTPNTVMIQIKRFKSHKKFRVFTSNSFDK